MGQEFSVEFGLIFLLSATLPLHFLQFLNLIAAVPRSNPPVVPARFESIMKPQTA